MQSYFIICLEQDSDSRVGIRMVRRACFCLDASFLDVLHHATFIIYIAIYERKI